MCDVKDGSGLRESCCATFSKYIGSRTTLAHRVAACIVNAGSMQLFQSLEKMKTHFSSDFALGRLIGDEETFALQTHYKATHQRQVNIVCECPLRSQPPLGRSEILCGFQYVSQVCVCCALELGTLNLRAWFFLTQQGWHCSTAGLVQTLRSSKKRGR